jgi:hypothetical protein
MMAANQSRSRSDIAKKGRPWRGRLVVAVLAALLGCSFAVGCPGSGDKKSEKKWRVEPSKKKAKRTKPRKVHRKPKHAAHPHPHGAHPHEAGEHHHHPHPHPHLEGPDGHHHPY